MNEHIVYHIVTNRKMKLGQIIDFSSKQPNTLYNFFFTRECRNLKGEDVLQILRSNYVDGQISMDKEDSSAILKYYNQTIRAIRESIVEMVRLQEFPNYPSRLSCLYAARTYDEALAWKEVFESYNRNILQLVKLKAKGKQFVGDAMCLPDESGVPFAKKIEQARNYWNGDRKSDLLEVLIDGQIEVMEIIEDFTVNNR